MNCVISHSSTPLVAGPRRDLPSSAPDSTRLTLLRRLGAQVDRLRQDLRRTSSEALLLGAMEDARPLTPVERKRAGELRVETWRIQQDLLRLRREYAALQPSHDGDIHRDVHPPTGGGAARGSVRAQIELVGDP